MGIRWHTGATDELRVTRATHPGTAKRTPAAAIELVRKLGPTTSNDELIDRLNTAGMTTGHGRPFDIDAVQWIRHAYKIPVPDPYQPGEISVAEAARRLGCSTGVLYHWIHTSQLTARRGQGNRLCIPWNDQTQADCQTRIAQSSHLGRTARPRTLPAPAFPAADGDTEVSVTEAAYRLGCSTWVIYYWIETGNSPPAAAPGTGCTSPGTSRSKPTAAAASSNPGTSTRPPDAPNPGSDADTTQNVSAPSAKLIPTNRTLGGPDQHTPTPNQKHPTRGRRRGNMNHPSPKFVTVP